MQLDKDKRKLLVLSYLENKKWSYRKDFARILPREQALAGRFLAWREVAEKGVVEIAPAFSRPHPLHAGLERIIM